MAILKVNNVEKDDIDKQPWEKLSITIDFTDELGTGASVASFTTLVYDSSGTSVGTIILAGVSESSGVITIGLQAGVAGTNYTVTSRVTSDQTLPDASAQRFEADVKLVVKDVKYY